jgi:hypothetical protein
MPTFLLRVEAVNLKHVVYDTHDLNTIRGGGLAVLNGPRQDVLKVLQKNTAPDGTPWDVRNVALITSGPSLALIQFHSEDASAVRKNVAQWLASETTLQHATFTVEVIPQSAANQQGAFRKDSESLLARARWSQMQQCRLAIPSATLENDAESSAAERSCGVDFIRPATHQNPVRNDRKKLVSESVSARALYGRRQKQAFYREETQWFPPGDPQMASDFHQIAARGPYRTGQDHTERDPLARLHDKIALIYIDGNQFGRQQLAYVRDSASQKKWDDHVQLFRRHVLKTLLDQTLSDDQWKCKLSDAKLVTRLETLLWGGDELLWVVPAWKGWSTVKLFLDEARKFYQPFDVAAAPRISAVQPIRGNSRSVPNLDQRKRVVPPTSPVSPPAVLPRLTHSVGLVFCHADAPIQRVRTLATDLCDVGKDRNKNRSGTAYGSYNDVVTYAVLESFDQIGQKVLDIRKRHFPDSLREEATVRDAVSLTHSELTGLTEAIRDVKKCGFPRGSVYRILRAWQADSRSDFDRWLIRGEREGGTLPESLRSFERGALWLHVAELWDYVFPEVPHA